MPNNAQHSLPDWTSWKHSEATNISPHVREDAMERCSAFASEQELNCFKMLKFPFLELGLKWDLLSFRTLHLDQIALAIATGDSKAITRAKGVGPKQRVYS